MNRLLCLFGWHDPGIKADEPRIVDGLKFIINLKVDCVRCGKVFRTLDHEMSFRARAVPHPLDVHIFRVYEPEAE